MEGTKWLAKRQFGDNIKSECIKPFVQINLAVGRLSRYGLNFADEGEKVVRYERPLLLEGDIGEGVGG